MSSRVRVVAAIEEYRAAAEGLPFTAELVDRPAGALVVIDGRREWWLGAEEAAAAGASAVLIVEPVDARARDIAELAERLEVPAIVSRARLRHDLVTAAIARRGGAVPRVLVAECAAERVQLPAMVRDAVGWLRELSGAPLRVASASMSGIGGAAMVRVQDTGLVGSLVITAANLGGGVLRVQALGETRTEVEIDEPMSKVSLSTSTGEGRLVDPVLFETPERATLRRALHAAAERRATRDLLDLRHDLEIAHEILD